MNKPKKLYLEWLNKAQEDELSAGIILKEKGAPSTACFLSEQIAEKCLKGLMVFLLFLRIFRQSFLVKPLHARTIS